MKKIVYILILLPVIFLLFFTYIRSEDTPIGPPVDLREPGELKELSSSVKDFSFSIFPILAENDKNIFISPYSIHTALMMAYRGADENSALEMAEVLGVTEMELEALMSDSLGLKQYLEHFSEENEVSIANVLFLREGIPFIGSYKSDAERYFEGKIDQLPETGEPVNQWVFENTREKIDGIIDPGPIDPDVIAYLVNAIYFKGIWDEEFDEDKTEQRTFYGTSGETSVDMMENESDYLFAVSEVMKSLTIKYKDGDYLLHVFMPTDNRPLSELYGDLDHEIFETLKPTNREKITLRFPKFTLENELGLVDALKNLGLETVFDEALADFSNMADIEQLGLNVYISDVLHASFIEVDEKGTEAAAATAVEMRMESMPLPAPVVEFNRPFLFVIEEPETGTILFMGQLVDPN